ncbi:MAG TPA: pitrilysin family protein [Opitutaceae bacterium]|nr:pitrilysin family protein [Opitutaceae bacterium]
MNSHPRTSASLLTLAALLILSPSHARAESMFIEKVDRTGNELVIPYTKYMLRNGLILVVHEDHSDPVVHVDVTYHVGSGREEIGKSGFAHFFEHMMFQGSDHVEDEQHFKIVTDAGGTLNGSTNRDRTNYYETVPSNQLEKMLWLEADRMGFFLDAVTQRKFEVQRDTVKNERGQNYDNRPYGLVSEVTSKALYPYGHPYSWLTIGYVEDLNRVSVDDLKNFFLRWYGPNNATLTIGGDVDTKQVVALVDKYFGPIPRGPEVTETKMAPPVLDADRHVTLADNYARQPLLAITVPTVPFYHPDEAPLECLAEIIGQGRTSILYQQLTKPQKALNASASSSNYELSGEFRISVTPAPGTSLADTKKLVDEALQVFEKRGVTDADIAKFTGAVEATLINGLQSVRGKVVQLAAYQTYTSNPNRIRGDLERYAAVTKADVMRVYERYVKGKPAVILSVTTKAARDNVVAAENHTVSAAGYRAPDYGYGGLKYTKATDTFDRSKLPGNGPNPVVKVPPFWREELANGIRVIGAESREVPVVAFTLSLPGGHLLEARDRAKVGLARLHAQMMSDDTQNRTAEEMSVMLRTLGSSIAIGTDIDELNVSVQTLKKNLEKTLPLVEERLLRPKFTAEAFERLKKQTLEGFKNRKAQPSLVATEVFARLNHGPESILGVSSVGTEESVKRITLQDIEDYHRAFLTSRGGKLVVVGDVTQKEILTGLRFLTKLPDKEVKFPLPPAAPAIEKTRIYVVDVPKAAQTEFRVGYVTGVKYDATGEFYRLALTNFVLGGGFNGRVNINLREDKGWTYGARTSFSGDKYTGQFAFSSGIRADATEGALAEVLKELNAYAESGITEAELKFTKSALGQRDALLYETPLQKAGFIRRILDYNLPADYVDQQNKILAAMEKSEIDRLAAKWIQTKAINILLVGDKTKILPGVQKFGFEVIELDANGEVVKAAAGTD